MIATELVPIEAKIMQEIAEYIKNKYGLELPKDTRITIKRDHATFSIGVKLETWINQKYYAVATFIKEMNYKILLDTAINLAEEIYVRLPKPN